MAYFHPNSRKEEAVEVLFVYLCKRSFGLSYKNFYVHIELYLLIFCVVIHSFRSFQTGSLHHVCPIEVLCSSSYS